MGFEPFSRPYRFIAEAVIGALILAWTGLIVFAFIIRPSWNALPWLVLFCVPGVLVTSRLFEVMRRRKAERMRGKCPRCGYDLRGSVSPGCPECGTPVTERPELNDE